MLGLPRSSCGVVDGFSAAVVVCRASLCCASTAYASARRRLLESYMPLAAFVSRAWYSATTVAICAREHGRIQPETLGCPGQPFLQS